MDKQAKYCPGAGNIRGTPELTEKICPDCGKTIEIFSTDASARCECGFIAYNDAKNCVSWCKYARECVGDELYEMINKQ